MTETPEILDSHFRGNDVVQVSVWMDSSFPTTPQSRNSSFPRRRESRPLTRRGNADAAVLLETLLAELDAVLLQYARDGFAP
ncbi:hypothetical protein GQF37_11590, partial [Neisseria meningitidis]|nr:hypothetical protein [Neisseria meningitidis]